MKLQGSELVRKRSGLVYGGSSLLANVLGYAFLAVLSRSLAPAEYGAAGALLGAGVISSILSVALQLVVARQVAAHGDAAISGRVAMGLSVGTSAVALCLVPAAVHYLHLPSAWPAVWVALTLLPMTLAGALLGHLLGRERFVRLATATVFISTARLTSGLLAAVAGWGLSAALAALSVASFIAVLGLAVIADVPTWWHGRRGLPSGTVHDLLSAAGGVAAFLVLTNVDTLLARHYLAAGVSGLYILGSLFAKAGLWGPQFIAVVAFPRLSTDGDRRSVYRRAAAATAAFGLLVAVVSTVVAEPMVRLVSGQEYVPAARYAPAFAAMGTLFALVHLGLVSSIAVHGRAFGRLLWVGAGAESVVVSLWMHDSVGQILAVCATCAACLASAGWLTSRRSRVAVPGDYRPTTT